MTNTRDALPTDYRDNVLYLSSAEHLRGKFPRQVESLCCSSFSHGDSYTKMKGDIPFSKLRTSLEGRLLFDKREWDGTFYWVILDHIENHDTHKHRFQDKNVLDIALEKDNGHLLTQIEALKLKEIARQETLKLKEKKKQQPLPLPVQTAEEKNLEPEEKTKEKTETEKQALAEEYVYFNHQIIALNELQNKAVIATQPVIVTGLPGTGKTCVAMEKLLNALHKVTEEKEPERIVYVAASKNLCDNMQNMREQAPDFSPDDINAIEFKSYFELLQELAPDIQNKKLAEKNYFINWLEKSWLKKNPTLEASLNKVLTEGAELKDALYQECRMISASDEKECEDMGDRESLFKMENDLSISKRKELRRKLHSLLQDYRDYLNATHHIDPAFYELDPTIKDIFYQIVVDEAQDLSPLQLAILARLTKTQTVARYLPAAKTGEKPAPTQKNITFMHDGHQKLCDSRSKLPALKKIFGKEISESGVELTESLRCSKSVIETANTLLAMGVKITGGEKDTHHKMIPAANAPEGRTTWIDTPTEQQKTEISTLIQSHKCAVIVPPHLLKEAETEFSWKVKEGDTEVTRTAQILTIEQAKGLEFETVILWRMLEGDRYKQINKHLVNFDQATVKKTGRGKESYPAYGPDVSILFTATTRARKFLIFDNHSPKNTKRNDIRHIRENLKKTMSNTEQSASPLSDNLGQSTKQDWTKQVEDYLSVKDIINARKFYLAYVENNEGKFSQFAKSFNERNAHKKQAVTVSLPTAARLKQLLQYESHHLFGLHLLKLFEKGQFGCLFDVPVDGNTWFSFIKNDIPKLTELNEVLKQKRFAKNFTASYLSTKLINTRNGKVSLLHYLLSTKEGRSTFKSLLNSDIEKEIKAADLFLPIEGNAGELENTSAAYWLSAKKEKDNLFAIFLNKNIQIAKELTAADLKRTRTAAAGKHANKSVFFNLAKNDPITLWKIFDANEDLLKEFTIEDLTLEIQDEGSALYHLSNSEFGRLILSKFINKNDAIAKQMTFDVLDKAHLNHYSALANLFKNVDQLSNSLLEEVLDKNKNMPHSLTKQLLFKKLPDIIGDDGSIVRNWTLMHYIARSKKACALALAWIKSNNDIAENITIDDLLDQIEVYDKHSRMVNLSTSVHTLLNEHKEGKELLKEIFSHNAGLHHDILTRTDSGKSVPSELTDIKKNEAEKENKGEIIAKRLGSIGKNFEMLLGQPAFAFGMNLKYRLEKEDIIECLFRAPVHGKMLFSHIEQNNDYTKELITLLKQSEFSKKFTATNLTKTEIILKPENKRIPLLGYLVNCKLGNSIIPILLDNNSDIIKNLKAEDLKPILVDFSRFSIKNLLRIFKENSELATYFTPEDIFSENGNENALYLLTLTPEGLELLDIFIAKIPKFLEKTTLAILTKPHRFTGFSPLVNLCNAIDDYDNFLLDKFLIPSITNAITVKTLCCPTPSINQEEIVAINYSCLAALANSKKGCAIILKLLELIPDLSNGITVAHLLNPVTYGSFRNVTTESCYDKLQKHPYGRTALEKIFEKNKKLCNDR